MYLNFIAKSEKLNGAWTRKHKVPCYILHHLPGPNKNSPPSFATSSCYLECSDRE